MSQPKWKLFKTLGDISVPEYDGALLFYDETGVYPPELEIYEVQEKNTEDDLENWPVEVYRIIVEPSPTEWYMDKLDEVARTSDIEEDIVRKHLLSDKPFNQAYALYTYVIAHFGAFEFDQYPLTMKMSEAKERVEKHKRGER